MLHSLTVQRRVSVCQQVLGTMTYLHCLLSTVFPKEAEQGHRCRRREALAEWFREPQALQGAREQAGDFTYL